MFKTRSQKLGYNHDFIDRETYSYKEVRRYGTLGKRGRIFSKQKVLIPIVYDKGNDISRQLSFFLRKAAKGMSMARSISIGYKVLPKLRNKISTRRILYHKLRGIKFGKLEAAKINRGEKL